MKIPVSWLQEFVPFRIKVESLAERLTLAGFEVEAVHEVQGEKVLEINVTPNRGDCLSVRGIAREVAVLTGLKLRPLPSARFRGAGKISQIISVSLQERNGAPRYALRVMTDLTVGASPEWLVRRLTQCGVRSVNNIVDVTNYVLLETGQPLHAFDLEKIRPDSKGMRKIIIRKGGAGEKLTTLDGVERTLTPKDLLIADSSGGIALAGIMGGKDSEIGPETRGVALESAFFNPLWIRQTAKRLGASSESSYRFERRVDPEAVVEALQRATGLILELAGGTATQDWIDQYPLRTTTASIPFDPAILPELLGGKWPVSEAQQQLGRLGIARHGKGKKLWKVPSHRGDLHEGIDLAEEVARLGGYHRVPSTLPALLPSSTCQGGEARVRRQDRLRTHEARSRMTNAGFFEAVHLSFLAPETLRYDPQLVARAISLANPLGVENSLLRPTLVPSLLKTASSHHQHKIWNVRLFELRKIFWQEGEKAREALALAAVASGEPLVTDWSHRRNEVDFFDMKGVVEGLLKGFGLTPQFTRGENPLLVPGKSARILLQETELGWVGEIHPQVAEEFQLKKRTCLFEISWEQILKSIAEPPPYRAFSRLPQVQRDLAVVVDQEIAAGKIQEFLTHQERSLIRQVTIFDYYQGSQIPAGKKSLAFSLLLGRDDRTMTEEEINEAWRRILESVRREFHADIR